VPPVPYQFVGGESRDRAGGRRGVVVGCLHDPNIGIGRFPKRPLARRLLQVVADSTVWGQ
jgi:hypothetical protein